MQESIIMRYYILCKLPIVKKETSYKIINQNSMVYIENIHTNSRKYRVTDINHSKCVQLLLFIEFYTFAENKVFLERSIKKIHWCI